MGVRKSWLDFGDLDLIIKITPALWNVKFWLKVGFLYGMSWIEVWILAKLYVLYHSGKMKSLYDFGDFDLIFKVNSFSRSPSLKKTVKSAFSELCLLHQ